MKIINYIFVFILALLICGTIIKTKVVSDTSTCVSMVAETKSVVVCTKEYKYL